MRSRSGTVSYGLSARLVWSHIDLLVQLCDSLVRKGIGEGQADSLGFRLEPLIFLDLILHDFSDMPVCQ
jgi:hypothetical protein